MLAVVTRPAARPVAFEFGAPLETTLTGEALVRHAVADFDARRDRLWEVEPEPRAKILATIIDDPRTPPASRAGALRGLGQMGGVTGMRKLDPFLVDPALEVRVAAVTALGQMGRFASIKKIEPFLSSPEPAEKKAAISALGKFGKLEVVPEIEAAAEGDPELVRLAGQAKERIQATRVAIEDADYRPFADAILRSDDYEDLVAWLPVAAEATLAILADPTRPEIERRRAVRVLTLGRQPKAAVLFSELVTDERLSVPIRREMALGLGHLGYVSAYRALGQLLDGTEESLQHAAVDSMGRLGSADALAPLIDHWDVREGALRHDLRLAIRRISTPNDDPLSLALVEAGPDLVHEVFFITDALELLPLYQYHLSYGQLVSPHDKARRDGLTLFALFGKKLEVDALRDALRSERDPHNLLLGGKVMARLTATAPPVVQRPDTDSFVARALRAHLPKKKP